MGSTKQEAEDASLAELSDIQFIPPLYEQRYQEIVRIVREYQPKKVVDIGCGELSVIRLLKFHEGIHELVGLDVDVETFRQRLFLIQPIPACYLTPRPHPFTIILLQGSIAQQDARLLGCDLAVCVEVIEHMYPEDLSKATEVIFGFMQPARAVFTTPNAEFNVLFPGFQGFRHDDHKFEWTRKEFQEWGDAICLRYSYTVEYSGLGAGPAGSEHLGCCTQTAFFQRTQPHPSSDADLGDHQEHPMVYEEVAREEYPFRLVEGDQSQEVVTEVQYRVRQLLRDARWDLDEEEGQFYNASEDEAEGDEEIHRWVKERLAGETGGGISNRDNASSRYPDYASRLQDQIGDQATNDDSIVDLTNCPHDHITQRPQDQNGVQTTMIDNSFVDLTNCPSDERTLECLRTGIIDIDKCATLLLDEGRHFRLCCTNIDSGMTFCSQWEKGFVVDRDYVVDELRVRIPFSRLLMFSSLQKLCPDIEKLRDIIVSSGQFTLDEDSTAIICDLYEESEISSKLDDLDLIDDGNDNGGDFRVEDWEEESWD